MIRSFLAWATLISAAHGATADGARVNLNVEACGPAPAAVVEQQDAATWQIFKPYLQFCPVFRPDGDRGLALSVLIVRVDWADAAGLYYQQPNQPALRTPDPVIYDNMWLAVGTLPAPFPTSVPGETRVVFTHWQHGWPQRIETRRIRAAALGTFDAPPLVWSDATQQYEMLVSFNEKDCYDPPAAMMATLDAKWPGWRQRDPTVQACSIFSSHGEFVLDVVIPRRELSVDARGARRKPGWARPAVPEPALYILDPQHRGLGEAPVGPPAKGSVGTVAVLFTNCEIAFRTA